MGRQYYLQIVKTILSSYEDIPSTSVRQHQTIIPAQLALSHCYIEKYRKGRQDLRNKGGRANKHQIQ